MGSSFVLERWLTPCQFSTTQCWNKKNRNQLLVGQNPPTPMMQVRVTRRGREEAGQREHTIHHGGHDAGVTSQQRIWHQALSHHRGEWAAHISQQLRDKCQIDVWWTQVTKRVTRGFNVWKFFRNLLNGWVFICTVCKPEVYANTLLSFGWWFIYNDRAVFSDRARA